MSITGGVVVGGVAGLFQLFPAGKIKSCPGKTKKYQYFAAGAKGIRSFSVFFCREKAIVAIIETLARTGRP